MTLSQVRGDSVPRASVTLAVGLVLIDAVAVLRLLASLRHAVTGGGLTRAVGERLRTVVDEVFPATAQACAPVPGLGGGTPLVHRGPPAVVFSVDEPRVTRLAARHDIHVQLLCSVGDFVGSHTTVALLHTGGAVPARLVRRTADCVRSGPSRTVRQDAGYGFRLLADIAIRALSPAVNDPTTAVKALDQIEAGLLRLAGRPLGPSWLLDRAGHPRVHCHAPHCPDFVSLALDPEQHLLPLQQRHERPDHRQLRQLQPVLAGTNGSRCSSYDGALGWSFAPDGRLAVTFGGTAVTP